MIRIDDKLTIRNDICYFPVKSTDCIGLFEKFTACLRELNCLQKDMIK